VVFVTVGRREASGRGQELRTNGERRGLLEFPTLAAGCFVFLKVDQRLIVYAWYSRGLSGGLPQEIILDEQPWCGENGIMASPAVRYGGTEGLGRAVCGVIRICYVC
jgi:hypothetical protein